MDLMMDLTLLLNSHGLEQRRQRDVPAKLLAAIIAVRAVIAMQRQSERSRRLRKDLTGELFKKSARLPLFYQRCECELKRTVFQLGTWSLPLTSLRSISVSDEGRFEFSLCTTEGTVQLRVASGSTAFQRWVSGFASLIADFQRRSSSRTPTPPSTSPSSISPASASPTGSASLKPLWDIETGVCPSDVGMATAEAVRGQHARCGSDPVSDRAPSLLPPRRIVSFPERLDARGAVECCSGNGVLHNESHQCLAVGRSDSLTPQTRSRSGELSAKCLPTAHGRPPKLQVRQSSVYGTFGSMTGLPGTSEASVLPIYAQDSPDGTGSLRCWLVQGCRGASKFCSMTYLSALCYIHEYLPWHSRCRHPHPGRSNVARRVTVSYRFIIFCVVLIFGCNRIPPSAHVSELAERNSPPATRKLRLFHSSLPPRPSATLSMQRARRLETLNESYNPAGPRTASAPPPPVHFEP